MQTIASCAATAAECKSDVERRDADLELMTVRLHDQQHR